MSLVIFRVWSNKVTVAVDTLGGTATQQMHINKLFAIPVSNMVLAGRGSAALLSRAAEICGQFTNIDEAKQRLCGELPSVEKLLRISALVAGHLRFALKRMPTEIFLFGWSVLHKEMIALHFTWGGIQSGWHVDDEIQCLAAPALEGMDLPEVEDEQSMLKIAAIQVAQANRSAPGVPIGGRLVVAHLTRIKVTIETAGEIVPDLRAYDDQPSKRRSSNPMNALFSDLADK